MYPAPGLVIGTVCTDCNLGLALRLQTLIPPIIVAVAIPVMPVDGAEDIATVGISPYPPPLLVTFMNLIPPDVMIPVTAVAVTPVPTNVRVCVTP